MNLKSVRRNYRLVRKKISKIPGGFMFEHFSSNAPSTIIKKQSMNFVSLSMNNGLSIEEFQSSYPQNRPTLPRISRATIDPIGKECQTTPDEAPLPDE